MVEEYNWLIILVIFALLIFYSNSNHDTNTNTVKNYRVPKTIVNDNTNLESYKQIKKEANVYVGEYPLIIDDNNNNGNDEFAAHSIYEVGRINPFGSHKPCYYGYYGGY